MSTLLGIAISGLVAIAPAPSVKVRVSGVAPQGSLYAQLCTESEGLTRRCAISRIVQPARGGVTEVSFPDVAPGRYVASAFQDTDGDRRLSFGFMGRPSEPWGYSRNARGVMGPPNFRDAVVVIGPGGAVIPVSIRR